MSRILKETAYIRSLACTVHVPGALTSGNKSTGGKRNHGYCYKCGRVGPLTKQWRPYKHNLGTNVCPGAVLKVDRVICYCLGCSRNVKVHATRSFSFSPCGSIIGVATNTHPNGCFSEGTKVKVRDGNIVGYFHSSSGWWVDLK